MRNLNIRDLIQTRGGTLLMIVGGAVLVLSPDSASVLVSAVLGWLIIAGGVMMLIAGFVDGFSLGTVVQGALLLVAGSWLHRNPLMIAAVLGFVLGLMILRRGWRAAREAFRIRRSGGNWILPTVFAVLEILVGIRLILSPLSMSRTVVTLAGIAVIAFGVWDLLSARRITGNTDRIIDADE